MPYIPKRYIIVLLCCFGMLIAHAMRVSVAVTVVTILDKHPQGKVGTIEAIVNLPDVMWNSKEVGLLHSVFYVGYIVTQIPGGYLAQKVPCNRLFGSAVTISCILSLFLPISISDGGYIVTCVVRCMQGLSEGLLFPSSYAILRHWATPQERSIMGAILLTGVYVGPVLGLPVSGFLTHYLGWQYVYYLFGILGIVWMAIWLLLSYDTPSVHPTIHTDELKFILESQGVTAVIYEHDKVPWWEIMTSMPLHALNVCNFSRSFIFFLLLTNEPTYLNVFGFSLAENGVLSSLPHIMMTITCAISGPIADLMISDPMLSRTQVRKLFTGIGFGVEALCCFFLYFISTGLAAVIYLVIGVGFSGFTISGWQINHLDLAPRYASILVGITTAAGTLAGILMPLIIGAMTMNQTIDEWQNVFLLTSLVIAFSVVFYTIFGSGELQSWAEPKPEKVQLVDKSNALNTKPYYSTSIQTPQPTKEFLGSLENKPLNDTGLVAETTIDEKSPESQNDGGSMRKRSSNENEKEQSSS